MRYFIILPLLVFLALPASAQFTGPGGQEEATVQSILDDPNDDQAVILTGHLLEKVGSEEYTFSDETGQIRVEIDSEAFPEEEITETTDIRIHGEVEKDFWQDPEIDVDSVEIVNQ